MGKPRWIVAGILCAVLGLSSYEYAKPDAAVWHEIVWPFPRDGWPAGRAFRCSSAVCGDEVEMYVRPKIGFCNCDSGVADDDEVDRVADLDLISERFIPLAAGKPVRLGEMNGRVRRYNLELSSGARKVAVGIAVSRRCDLLVAIAQGKVEALKIEQVTLEFLSTTDMKRWMASAM